MAINCPTGELWNSFVEKLGKHNAYRMWLMHGADDNAMNEMQRILDPKQYTISQKILDLEIESDSIIPVTIADAKLGEKTHRYEASSSGEPIKSVSEVLDETEDTKYDGNPVGSVYAEKGDIVHKVFQNVINQVSNTNIEQYLDENNIPRSFFGQVKDALSKITNNEKDGILVSEKTLGDVDHNIGGTTDIIFFKYDGTVEIIDIKTVHKTPRSKGELWNPVQDHGGYKARRYPTQTKFYARLVENALKQPVTREWILPIEVSYHNDKPSDGFSDLKILDPEDTNSYGFSRKSQEIVDLYFGDKQPSIRGSLSEPDATTEVIENLTGSPEDRSMDYDFEARKILSGKYTFNPRTKKFKAGSKWVYLRGNTEEQWITQITEEYLKKNTKAKRNILESMKNYHAYKKDAFLDDPGLHSNKIAENVKQWISVYNDKTEMYELSEIEGFGNKKNWLVFENGDTMDLLYMGPIEMEEKISVRHNNTLFGDYMTKGQAYHFLGSELKNTRRDAKRLEGALIMMQLKNAMPEKTFERAFIYSSFDNKASAPAAINMHDILPVIKKMRDRSEFQEIIPENLKKLLRNDNLYDAKSYTPDRIKIYQDYIYAHGLIKDRKTIQQAIDLYTTGRDDSKLLESMVSQEIFSLDAKNDPETLPERYRLAQLYYELRGINSAAMPINVYEKVISMPNNIKTPVLADVVSQVQTSLNNFKQNYWNKYKVPADTKFKALFKDAGITSAAENIFLADTTRMYKSVMMTSTYKVAGTDGQEITIPTFELIPEDSPAFNELSKAQQDFIVMFNDMIEQGAKMANIGWVRGRVPLIKKTALRRMTEAATGKLTRKQIKELYKESFKENFVFTTNEDIGTHPHGIINLFSNQSNDDSIDPREGMLGFSKDGHVIKEQYDEYENNLEIVLDAFMMNANKVRELQKAAWVFSAAKSLFEYQQSKFFERSLGGSVDWAEVWKNAILNNMDKVEGSFERNAMRLIKPANFLASLGIIGFKPTTAAIATMGQELTLISKSVANKFHDEGLFTYKDFAGATKHLLNPKHTRKIDLIMNEYGFFDMDINALRSSQRRSTDKFLFNTKFAYMFLRWGDWATRAQAIVAQMLHDGTWDAYTVQDGKLVYDESKDNRFNGKGRFTLDQGRALKKALKLNLEEEGYVSEDGTMMRAYDDNLVKKHKDLLDSTLGGMDKETRSWYNYTWFGKLLGVFKSWLPARLDESFQRPGTKNLAGDYRFSVDKDGNLVSEWTGLQVEGLIHTLKLIGFNIDQKLKGLETKPMNEAQKANVARLMTNLVIIGVATLGASALPDDDESKLDDESRRLITGALQDLTASYLIFDHLEAVFGMPVAFTYMKRVYDAVFEAITGVPFGDTNVDKILRITPISREIQIIDELMREN